MRITILESDKVHINALVQELRKNQGLGNPAFSVAKTEAAFRLLVDEPEVVGSDLFILDLNCPWANPGDDALNIPEEVIMGGAYNAGFRAHKLIRERRPDVPIIFWSALVGHPNVDLTPYLNDLKTRAVPKGQGELIPAVKSLLGVTQ